MTMKFEQLLLFEEPLEIKLLREIKEVKQSLDKVRKGQFAKIGDIKKSVMEIMPRIEIIEKYICHSNIEDKLIKIHQSYERLEAYIYQLQIEMQNLKEEKIPLQALRVM
jgi:hypothetical protein